MDSGSGKNKKRKRRRKQPPSVVDNVDASPVTSQFPQRPDTVKTSRKDPDGNDNDDDEEEYDVLPDAAVDSTELERFKFRAGRDVVIDKDFDALKDSGKIDSAIPLPDIREARKRKQLEAEIARMEEEKAETRVKIKRSDKEAFIKLLEQQPFADADDSYFEAEDYGTVSALFGEGASPFLGIPTGPLQVGHFIGALGIILMAFVEYPGFPLTNLPTPLRDALQVGLGVVYLINFILAIGSIFKASERGQSKFLWAAKTFTIGGLAYDQLTQLPTLGEVAKIKAKKGKRAIKNRK